ncbi:MAG TPA: ABC transporter substrate-binding protein [Chloroflexus aurantiacus]|jgi:ABC-type nitrate/sulfonate/bicarbonate transport system substrate-binding protein|uniref:NMT1/THI5 like domain protein n=1 Tax=Chloroflexus aurantiacus (strain ATCC 29366 / DSM 635 / J-10-fl) TaxID=324602 RepID=A9WDR9_CHLAA|nr:MULTISPECIES: ABC transporter substrate-binding protein [Chloroflexus]ABY33675.1 NMT1/THI5 like domain protein [Chloroflexus aurantiacus J-10-fl]RMG47108.1 MAG: ABC transporter substrate-binding protein [Chloroflexota bacterium]GIV94301.1 MAG: nitrate ABC transporter substrate-binding protein [Chloroflexus sp.]HBW68119.1 ABC transporter substrate-binding protein [Chloroflexus aurantiacus]
MRRWLLLGLIVILTACGAATTPAVSEPPLTTVRVGLDWTPNTNHTGLYVAQAQGYYRDQGLQVEILGAQEGGTVEQLVAAGRLDFGISYQEGVTQARVEGVPIVSIAAIIQHNTSGFASRVEEGITSPRDFIGKKYGAFGSPIEEAVIRGLLECAGVGDQFDQVQFVDIGSSDFFVATERDEVDFVWIFKGWTGIEAEVRGVPLNIVMMNDVQCIPDYYTPVIITSEKMIAEQPDLVRRFLAATSAGYRFAIDRPAEAAEILLQAAPELDAELVRRSQQYLATQYQADAPRWGEQKLEVWRAYAQWMAERNLIARMIEPEKAFTNEFLP